MIMYFIEDFEEWNNNGWTLTLGSNNYPQILASAKRTGNYGMRVYKPSGVNTNGYISFPDYDLSDKIGDHNIFTMIIYIKGSNLNIENGPYNMILDLESLGEILLDIEVYKVGNEHKYKAYCGLPTVSYYGYIGVVSGGWDRIRFDYKEDAVNGVWRIWFNDTKVYEYKGDTTGLVTEYLDYMLMGMYGFTNNSVLTFDFDNLQIKEFMTVTPFSTDTSVLYHIEDIHIGKDGTHYFEWKGIEDIKFADVSPWEHIEIPHGPMIHQHVHSPHCRGEIICVDFNAMYKALFNNPIDTYDHNAIESPPSRTKWNVNYFIVAAYTQSGKVVAISFNNFKVEFINVIGVKVGIDSLWSVHFTADSFDFTFVP